MTNIDPLQKCRTNVAQLIRDVHEVKPDATNQEIKTVIQDVHGIEAGSNQIIQTLSSEKERLPLMKKREKILPHAEKLLQECEDNYLVALSVLRLAVQ